MSTVCVLHGHDVHFSHLCLWCSTIIYIVVHNPQCPAFVGNSVAGSRVHSSRERVNICSTSCMCVCTIVLPSFRSCVLCSMSCNVNLSRRSLLLHNFINATLYIECSALAYVQHGPGRWTDMKIIFLQSNKVDWKCC